MAYFDPETLRLRSATTQEIVDAYTRRRVLTRLNLSPLEPHYGTLVLDAVGSGRFSPTDVQISVQGALDLTDWLTSAVVGFEVVGDRLSLNATGQVSGETIQTSILVPAGE